MIILLHMNYNIITKEGYLLIKAYIKGGIITVTSGKKSSEFPAGAAAVSLGGSWDFVNPYGFFDDYNESELSKFAANELNKLYSIDGLALDSLGEFDAQRKNKVYILKDFTVSFDAENGFIPCFTLSSAKELFALEILTAVSMKKPLKICENCGGFFFPSGRSDSVYCDRITENGYSCKKIGAHRQYRKNSRASDIKKLYDKVTKHNRYLKSKGALSSYEYRSWMTEASSKYADFKAEKLSPVEFEAWLLGKEAPAPRTRSRNTISDYLL